ncbi:alpha/beta fold hydrolase [Streptomyces sp. NPDC093510]|uniref:thioesterase II family protein n=1 Tax=Streptomyces sp. NPDC093510 TaxID=3155199 RepID=UPI00343E874B
MNAHVNDLTDNPWIRRYRTSQDGAPRLVCFPHAGGSASFYFPLAQALAPGIDALVVQYPGRQDRRAEPFVDSVPALADHIAAALRPFAGGPGGPGEPGASGEPGEPLTFFGHSLGAVLAFEVARRLAADSRGPRRLFVSARRAPSRPRVESVHTKTDDELIAQVRRLSGTDPRVLGNEEIMRMALPAIRNDYRAIETYRPEPGARVDCPLTVLVGDDDPTTTVAEAAAWSEHTTSGCDLRVFAGGGHFYLADPGRDKEVCDAIREGMRVPVPGGLR